VKKFFWEIRPFVVWSLGSSAFVLTFLWLAFGRAGLLSAALSYTFIAALLLLIREPKGVDDGKQGSDSEMG
jgi:hypothetical protein